MLLALSVFALSGLRPSQRDLALLDALFLPGRARGGGLARWSLLEKEGCCYGDKFNAKSFLCDRNKRETRKSEGGRERETEQQQQQQDAAGAVEASAG